MLTNRPAQQQIYKEDSMFNENSFSLKGKIALVSGASYGIWFAITSGFTKYGATIVFNDINHELVDKGLASYKEKGIAAHGYVCDVTDEAAVQKMVAENEKTAEIIDILINNAGIIDGHLYVKCLPPNSAK